MIFDGMGILTEDNNSSYETSVSSELYSLCDESLCRRIADGADGAFEVLASRYEKVICFCINNIFPPRLSIVGGISDFDDLLQECVLVLYKSALKYDSSKNAKFSTFFGICLRNFLVSCYRKYKKNSGVSFVSLDEAENVPEGISYPFTADLSADSLTGDSIADFTDFERSVFKMYLENSSYKFIAQTLGKNLKSIDNALKRIKAKLRKKYNFDTD